MMIVADPTRLGPLPRRGTVGGAGAVARAHLLPVCSASVTDRLNAGDAAPEFTLVDQSGDQVSLSTFRGRRVLVYFYPKADTPGCTAQACGLRDVLSRVGDTAVVGISPDPPKKQAAFDHKYGLGFPLLSDADHSVAEAYGVWVQRSMYGRSYMGIERSAFLVGEDGVLEHVWYKVSPAATTENLLKAVG
jgi:peroxiredoxin Q/BCP